MNRKDISERLKQRFQQVYWSFYLCNSSLTELHHLTNTKYQPEEVEIIDSHTFQFYRVTLQYCFIIEFNKLLEKGRDNNREHISSLIKLNETLRKELGDDFQESYDKNKEIINEIKSSEYYDHIRLLRDKKFAHSDKHQDNLPFKIKGLVGDEIFESFEYLKKITDVIKNCTVFFGFEYDLSVPSWENRTVNFVRLHSIYKHHYYKSNKG